MKKVYVSLDIGSDSIRLVAGELFNDKINILASSRVASNGIKKGLIVDANEVAQNIRDGVNEINKRLGFEINKVIVNVPSYNARCIYVASSLDIAGEDNIISSSDVNELIKKSVYSKVENGYELVTVIPLEFVLDNDKGIDYPVGKKAKLVNFKGIMIIAPAKNIYSVMSVVESAGLEVFDITFSGIADYFEVRNKDINKKLSAVINLGHELTTVSVINRGKFMNTSVIPIGAKNIHRDLEYFFKIGPVEARMLAERFASSHKRFSQTSESIEIVNVQNQLIKLNQIEASEIVYERMLEIMNLAKKELGLLSKQNPEYIIFTGGLTEIKAFKHLAFDIFEKDVIIYSIDTLGVRESEYITALGMLKYLVDKMKVRGKDYSMISCEDEMRLTTPSRAISNNTETKLSIPKIFTNFLSSNKEEK